MELILKIVPGVIWTALVAIATSLIRLGYRTINRHIYKNKLLINKNQINSDFSNIICYTANPDNYDKQEHTALGYPFEYMALGEVNSMFRYVYKIDKSIACKMAKCSFEENNPDLQNHLILIGGPPHNSITKHIFDKFEIPFSFGQNNTLIYQPKNESNKSTLYHPELANGNEDFFKKDYALILNIRNPYAKDNARRLILICGCRSIGCYGGAVFLSNHLREIKKIVKDSEYALVVECEGNAEGLICEPKLEEYYPLNTT